MGDAQTFPAHDSSVFFPKRREFQLGGERHHNWFEVCSGHTSALYIHLDFSLELADISFVIFPCMCVGISLRFGLVWEEGVWSGGKVTQ